MGWNLTVAALLNSLGSLPLVVLGVWVALLRPRTRGNLAFGLTSSGFGVAWGFHWLLPTLDEPIAPFWFIASTLGFLASAVGSVLLAIWFPRPLVRGGRRAVVLPVVAGVVLFATNVAVVSAERLAVRFPGLVVGDTPPPWLYTWDAASSLMISAWWTALLLLALRFGQDHPDDGKARQQIALMSAAMLVWLVFRDAVAFQASGSDAVSLASASLLIVLTVLWLRNTRTSESRLARSLALWGLGVALAGTVWRAATGDLERAVDSPVWGLLRLAAVGILAYAILRHQLLGIDVKLRFAISSGTVAGVFIAVFFIASAAAQEFFGDASGSQYVGIIAAGLLVFAIAPLSRLADRLAEKAVPLGASGEAPRLAASAREESYKDAVRLALQDRKLSRAEERDLFRLARVLGLEADRAHEIITELESLK